MSDKKTRERRAELMQLLNFYEIRLEEAVQFHKDFKITSRVEYEPTYGPSSRGGDISELFQPSIVELRAMLQKQIELFRDELKDLI